MEAVIKKQPNYLLWGALIFIPLYVFGAWLFKPSDTEISGTGIFGSILILCLVAFFFYIAFAVWWRMHETGTRVFTTAEGTPRFAIPEGVKKISLASDKEFSDRSLWVCIVVGAIGFHWFHSIYPLFICMIVRSFFLPTTKFSVWARWAYIIMMFVFYYLPGTETYSVAKMGDLETATKKMGLEATKPNSSKTAGVPPQAQPQIVEAPVESFKLTSEWLGPFTYPPAGGVIKYECTAPGAEMRIDFDSARDTLVDPGQIVPCRLRDQEISFGHMFVNAHYYFRSRSDSVGVHIQGAVHGPI